MIANYLKASIANLYSNRFYTLINFIGLAIGLASFIFITLFVRYELSYDSQWHAAEHTYRISRDYHATEGSSEARVAGMAGPAAPLLENDFPEIERAARIFCCGALVKTEEGEPVLEGNYAMADNVLFEIFDFEWLSGDPVTALTEPYTVVLTESAAKRHFGDVDPMGQVIQYGGGQNWETARVTGVIADLPENTHLQFDFLESMLAWTDCQCDFQEQTTAYFNDWRNDVFYTYAMLHEGDDIAAVRSQSGAFFERHLGEGASRETGFTATPIGDIHLGEARENELWLSEETPVEVSYATLYTFSAIAVFILLLACINFANLTTARSAQRGREIGIRKVLGAGRSQVMGQFMLESFLLVFLAAFLAVALVEFLMPAVSRFLVQELAFEYARDLNLIMGLTLLTVLTAVIAGSYPAFHVSTFRPEQVLKGQTQHGPGAVRLRRLLVIFQFSISITLLICTLVVYQQMQFIRNTAELGFNKDQIVVLSPSNVGGEEWRTLKREWLAYPDVLQVTSSRLVPFQNNPYTAEIRAMNDNARVARMQFLQVDYDFFETYDIALQAGRTFSEDYGTDRYIPPETEGALGTQPFVLNASAVQALGWTAEEAIGKRLSFTNMQGIRFQMNEVEGPVVGVIDDIHFESVHSRIEPLVFTLPGNSQGTVSLQISGHAPSSTMEFIGDTWSRFSPNLPPTLEFLEQRFKAQYQREEQQQRIFTLFSSLAMLIACLGLLGLAAFNAEQRSKEIGVRKVMGSSVWRIVLLLTNDFSKLILVSNLIAWPVAYAAMNRWLENFAYRIDLTLLTFIGSGLIALCIAWVTVGGIAAKAASAKPVLVLRYE